MAGSTYTGYWEARNIRPHLKHIRPATLLVGGWFDAEDMFGSLRTYEAIEQQTANNDNHLIMGPWTHGGWGGGGWTKFGMLDFGQNVNDYYPRDRNQILRSLPAGQRQRRPAGSHVFETGTNKWKTYDTWPPAKKQNPLNSSARNGADLRPGEHHRDATPQPPAAAYDEYVSDPAHPVPYIDGIHVGRDNQYIVTDQRFAAQRPDVLSYETDPLTK